MIVGGDVLDGNPQKLASSLSGNPYDAPFNEEIKVSKRLYNIVEFVLLLLYVSCRWAGRRGLSIARLYTVVQEDCIHISCFELLLLEAERSGAK